MRVLVFGSRDYADGDRLYGVLEAVHRIYGITTIIEGGARGADRLGREWAQSRGIPFETYEADWDRWGKRAGYERNAVMAALQIDVALGFPLDSSKGTWDMMNQLVTKDA